MRHLVVAARRKILKRPMDWCNRNLSQRNLQWIADHSHGWVKIQMRPVPIPGTFYSIADVKVMDWIPLS